MVYAKSHDDDKGSTVLSKTRDYAGNALHSESKRLADNLVKYDASLRQQTPSDRRLAEYFDALRLLQGQLNIPSHITEEIRYTLQKLEKLHQLESRATDRTLLAAYYICSRIHRQDVSFKKLVKFSGKPGNLMFRYIEDFKAALKLNLAELSSPYEKTFNDLCTKMNAGNKTRKIGYQILDYCHKKALFGSRQPMVFAATVLYIANWNTARDLSIEQIAGAAQVSIASMTNLKRNLIDVCNILRLSLFLQQNIANYREENPDA